MFYASNGNFIIQKKNIENLEVPDTRLYRETAPGSGVKAPGAAGAADPERAQLTRSQLLKAIQGGAKKKNKLKNSEIKQQ